MIITVNCWHYLATLGGRLSLHTQKKTPSGGNGFINFLCFVDKNSSWLGLVRHCLSRHAYDETSAANYSSSYKLASIQFHTREEVSQPLK